MKSRNTFYSHPDFERLYIFGAGGFGREVAWLAEQSWHDKVAPVFVVDKPEFLGDPVNNIPIVLTSDILAEDAKFCMGVGDPVLKRIATDKLCSYQMDAARLIHPRTEISNTVSVSDGVIVCAGCILTVNIKLAQHVHINLDCTIGHDVEVGEFSTLSPGVHVSGNVQIGSDVFIGTGANIINGTRDKPLMIGSGVIIGAGAVVNRDVPANTMVAGVPHKKIRDL